MHAPEQPLLPPSSCREVQGTPYIKTPQLETTMATTPAAATNSFAPGPRSTSQLGQLERDSGTSPLQPRHCFMCSPMRLAA